MTSDRENLGIKKNSTEDVSKLLSSKLLLGWALLDDCCSNHFIPLLRSPHNKLLKECVLCIEEQKHCNNTQLNQSSESVEYLKKKESDIFEKNEVSSFYYKNSSELSESLYILECASSNVFSSLKRCCAAMNSENIELELHLISKIKMCAETLESLEKCKVYFQKKKMIKY
ncbi:hypothetical protein PORY_002302 [Pneumocystis oryctolagi]|uniref:Uncharacterized protein n=1 Tax=Pneumocystis oryctolagi TaxID=42067 RepID=A0ACB7CB97_9ASCO|nr:hypothetical protein PORY_002302 [Pneumocystis oryctolagi]